MMFVQPEMTMVCGPNGAGKSTMTYAALHKYADEMLFIDPDRIAREKQCSPVEAGKIVSSTVKEYIMNRRSFIRESTLTSNFDFSVIKSAKDADFKVLLIYVGIDSPEYAFSRVIQRHTKGGHFVPKEDVRRRYFRSLENLPKAIKLVDWTEIFDNSRMTYRKVARFEEGNLASHEFTPKWFENILTFFQDQQESSSQNQQQENNQQHKRRRMR